MGISINEEVRNGYIVTEKLKKIWNVELDLMEKLFSVCEKYDLHPIVYSGTMLGAVRHRGFIPWDDDFDIALQRTEFNKLLEVAENEFRGDYFFQTALSDRKFFFGYARLRNSSTTGMITWNKSKDYNNGIYVDIYVLDGIPQNAFLLKKQYIEKEIVKQILVCYNIDDEYHSRKPKWLVKAIHLLAQSRPYEEWYKIYTHVISKYSGKADKLSQMTHEMQVIKKYWCYKSDLKDIIWVDFENTKVPVPQNYDSILRHFYGDYMKFPPVSERGAWHETQIEFDPDQSYLEYMKRYEQVKE